MPTTKHINRGTSVVRGSIGRIRVNAPREAFGVGTGVQRLGEGVQSVGRGVQRVAQENERDRIIAEKRVEFEKRQAEALVEQQNQLRMKEIQLTLDREQSKASNELKYRQGSEAVGLSDEFDAVSEKLYTVYSENLSEQDKASLKLWVQGNGSKYAKSLQSHERTETIRATKNMAIAKTESTIASASNAIGKLDGYNGFDDFKQEWYPQILEDAMAVKEAQGMGEDEFNAYLDKKRNEFEVKSIHALITNLGMDENSSVQQLEENASIVGTIIDENTDTLTPEQKLELKNTSTVAAKKRQLQLKREKQAIDTQKRMEDTQHVADAMGNIEGMNFEEQNFELDVAILTATPETKPIFKKLKSTVFSKESNETMLKLSEMKLQGVSEDEQRKYLNEMIGSGRLSREHYVKAVQSINTKLDSRVRSVMSQAMPQIKNLMAQNVAFAESLPGGVSSPKDVKKLSSEDAVNRQRAIVLLQGELENYVRGSEAVGMVVDVDMVLGKFNKLLKPIVGGTDKQSLYRVLLRKSIDRQTNDIVEQGKEKRTTSQLKSILGTK